LGRNERNVFTLKKITYRLKQKVRLKTTAKNNQ